MEKMMQL
jgi:hypothetical protein